MSGSAFTRVFDALCQRAARGSGAAADLAPGRLGFDCQTARARARNLKAANRR